MDLVAYDDLDALGAECLSTLQEWEQDLWHRLIEEPGSNPDDPDRGIGIYGRLSGPIDGAGLARDIDADFRKDPRTKSVTTLVTLLDVGEYQIDIACVGDAVELQITATVSAAQGVQRVAS